MASIDFAQVDWLYVILLVVFVCVTTFLGNVLSFNHRATAALLSGLLFGVVFVFWTYYPHRVPFLPRMLANPETPVAAPAPAATPAPAAPAAPQKPANPVRDITPPRNPVTDITPPAAAPERTPAAPAR